MPVRDDSPARGCGSSRLRRFVALFFVVAFLAMIWPVFPFFSRVRPLVLGMPFSLAWVAGWLVASFLALAGLYLWEERRREEGNGERGDKRAAGPRP